MLLVRVPLPLRQCILSFNPILSQIRRHTTTSSATTSQYAPLDHAPNSTPTPSLLTLSAATLNSYTFSNPPNEAQLKYASRFFTSAPPKILFSAAHFRDSPPSPFPEVAFLGRSNVGKSSLLNALFGRTNIKDAHVSKRPGRTKTMNGFGVSGGLPLGSAGSNAGEKEAAWKRFPIGGLVVVDMPGYGTGSREDWGKEIMKYLEKRKQLRRTFVLIDAEHGLKKSDISILLHLRRQGISHQVVLSKVDKLLLSGSKMPSAQRLSNKLVQLQDSCSKIRQKLDAEAGDRSGGVGDILCCSAEKSLGSRGHRKLGVDEVRWAVLSACGMESDEFGEKRSTNFADITVLDDSA